MKEKHKGFFVIDGRPFKNNPENRLEKVTDEMFETAREVKYVLPQGLIAIDADSKEAADKIDQLLTTNNIKTFEYATSKGHKHYWFSVPNEHQRYVDEYKLNSSTKKIALDPKIDTRSCSSDGKTGAIYLKTDGKEKAGRPKPEQLLESTVNLPAVPLYLIQPEKLGIVPKSGDGWDKEAFVMISRMKYAKYPLADINEIFLQAARFNGDAHNKEQIVHKYNVCSPLPWGATKEDVFNVSGNDAIALFIKKCTETKEDFESGINWREDELEYVKKQLEAEGLKKAEETRLTNKEGKLGVEIEMLKKHIVKIDTFIQRAYKLPDWLFPKLKYVKVDDEWKMMLTVGDTTDVQDRIIKEIGLTKYDGILMQNSEFIKEKLVDQVFRILIKEAKATGFIVDNKTAKEVAFRVEAVVESPIDDKDVISFKNRSMNWKHTFTTRKVSWLPARIENHNAIKWDYKTPKEIKESPKHMKMLQYMTKLFKDWKIPPKIIFKIGAYAMTKKNFAEKIFFFEGKGGEGKSEASLFIRRMFEDSACKTYDPINPALGAEMAFVGSQVVYNDDIDDGKLTLKHIKPAATGGYIDVRPLYQNNRAHESYSTMIFNTNYGLKTGNDATSKALASRVFVLKFTGKDMRGTPESREYKRINPSENKYFMEVFVSMCVENIPALLIEEFADPESMRWNKANAISSTNTVQLFIEDFDPDLPYFDRSYGREFPLKLLNNKTTMMELYTYYKNWAQHGNEFSVSKTLFKEQFQELSGIELNVSTTSNDGISKRWVDLTPLIEKVGKGKELI